MAFSGGSFPVSQTTLSTRNTSKARPSRWSSLGNATKVSKAAHRDYPCFYQQKIKWVLLNSTHPELYEQTKFYERQNKVDGSVPSGDRRSFFKDWSGPNA